MQVLQTDELPPYQGKIILAITGWTWKRRKALRKRTRMKAATPRPAGAYGSLLMIGNFSARNGLQSDGNGNLNHHL